MKKHNKLKIVRTRKVGPHALVRLFPSYANNATKTSILKCMQTNIFKYGTKCMIFCKDFYSMYVLGKHKVKRRNRRTPILTKRRTYFRQKGHSPCAHATFEGKKHSNTKIASLEIILLHYVTVTFMEGIKNLCLPFNYINLNLTKTRSFMRHRTISNKQ